MPKSILIAGQNWGTIRTAINDNFTENYNSIALNDKGNPWAGKEIVWVGTSIPAYGAGSYGSELSYPLQVGDKLGATIINESVSGSFVTWDSSFTGINWQKSLSATKAEIMAHPSYVAGYELNSFEEKLIGTNADLIVFDHGHNDRYKSLGVISSDLDKTKFYEAYNFVIKAVLNDKPSVRFVFITPPSKWTDNQNNGTILYISNAIKALAEIYGAKVIDLNSICGFNEFNHLLFFPDTIHPGGAARTRIAEILSDCIKGV